MLNQTEQLLLQTQGKLAALEAAFKVLLAMQLTSRMKGPEDFSKATEIAMAMRDSCLTLSPKSEQAPDPAVVAEFNRLFVAEFEALLHRCFDQTAEQIRELGDLVLQVTDPATTAKQ